MLNSKKILAIGLTGAMVLCSSVPSFAALGEESAEVTATGAGLAVAADMEIYSVELPTQDKMDKLFDFDVDPQGLVAETAGKKYGDNITVGDNTGVLFPNYSADGSSVTGVSDTSDSLIVTNKSSKGVKLEIACKLDGSGTYAAGYSTTPDFSGGTGATADSTKGLYFGLRQSGDIEHYFDGTGVAGSATTYKENAVASSADQYEVTATAGAAGTAGSYSYALKTGAEDFATYEFVVTGQLNDMVAESSWYTIANHEVTAKTFNSVQLKFTPSLITSKTSYDKKGVAYMNDAGVIILGKAGSAADGGFGETKPTNVIINGKDTTKIAAPQTANAAGYGVILWTDVLSAYGYTGDDYAIGSDNANELIEKINTVTFEIDGNNYYADVIPHISF
jgi:hypothetical protein